MTRGVLFCVLATLSAATLVAGCPNPYPDYVEVSAVTGAPPCRTARITNRVDDHAIHISRGVALGMRCYDTCDGQCIAPQFLVADPALIEVREAYFAGSAGHVIYGKASGTTTLTVVTTCSSQRYNVTVTADE